MSSIASQEKFDTVVSCSKVGVGANDWAVKAHPKFSMKSLQSLLSLLIMIVASLLTALVDCAAFFGFNNKRETARSLICTRYLSIYDVNICQGRKIAAHTAKHFLFIPLHSDIYGKQMTNSFSHSWRKCPLLLFAFCPRFFFIMFLGVSP